MLENGWGIVSFYNNPRDFFVQLERDLGAIERVTASVDEYASRFSTVNKKSKFYANDYVVAKWNEDDSWYRAVIDEVYEASETYKVTFIDFGNSVTVSSKDILSESTEGLFETSAIANRCCYFARDKTKMSDWESLLDQFKNEVSDDSRKFFIEAVGFSVSHHEVKLYTSAENKDKKLDLLGELKHIKGEVSNASVATVEYARCAPVSKSELGMVVYVKNVDEFYVQLNRDEAALNTAYKELADVQSRLSNKDGAATHMPPNSPCVVLHSEDSCLYRGQVVKRSFDSVTVKLVDFGEVMDVSSTNLYPAIDSLLKYPAFGLHCRVNVESNSRREVVFNILQSLMESSSPVRINFVSDSAPYTVILTATGSSQVLAGDEESLTSSSINTTCENLPDRSEMVPGTRFVGNVVYESVEKDGVMFLQTKSDEEESEKVQALLEENRLLTLKSNLMRKGQICIAPYEEVMYRAVIKKVDNHSKEVFFADFGNTESLPSDVEVFQMPTELKSIPPLCMKCRLVDYQLFSDLPLDESEVFIPTEFEVVSRTEDVWIVRHLDGKKAPEVIRYPFTKHTVGMHFTASFSHVSSKLGELSFCQSESAGDDLDVITSAIDSNMSSLKTLPSSQAQIGSACIAVHDEDKELYRAEIISLSGPTAVIRFVDFGNSKTSNISDLKVPPPSVTSLPSLAVPVLLTAPQLSQVEPDAAQYDVKLSSGDDVIGWRITIPEIDNSESGDASGAGKEIEVGGAVQKYVDLDLKSGNHLTGYFTYVPEVNSSASYFQTVKMGQQLEEITAAIEGLCDQLDNLPTHLVVEGRPCLAQDVDEVLYRGKISKLSDGNADVLFVDYGTSRTLPSMELRQIPLSLLQTPVCVIPVSLTSDQIITIDMDREDYDLEVLDGDINGGIRVAIDGDLTQKSVNDEGDRVNVDETVDSYEKKISIGKKISGYFAFVSEKEGVLSHFQTLEMSDTLNDIALQIEEVNDWKDLSPKKLKVGQACIAQDVDDVFYRATITRIVESDVEILFVDYGTSRTVSSTLLKTVPSEMLSIPVCLVPLLLTKSQMTDIDLDREDYEIEIVKGDEEAGFRVLIDGIVQEDFPSEDTSIMKANKDEKDIDAQEKFNLQTLYQKYENNTHKENQSLNGYFIFVSNITGGISYFQTHEMLNSVTSIGERISEMVDGCESLEGEELVVGQACLAQDVDDVFYRAVISEKKGNEYKVVFVDYGTSREVSTSLMKQIPNELVSRPMNIVPLNLTDEQQESIDMDREDYIVILREGSEAKGWSVSMKESDVIVPGGDVEPEMDALTSEPINEAKRTSDPAEYQSGSHAIGDEVIGFFTYLSHKEGSRCYFQTHDQLEKATAIGEKLTELLEDCESLEGEELVVGQACLAQDVDDVFYRAVISEKKGNEYKVVFVDYGTSREVSTSLMKQIPNELVSRPMNIVPLNLTDEQQESIDMDREDYTLMLREGSEAKGWSVSMKESDVIVPGGDVEPEMDALTSEPINEAKRTSDPAEYQSGSHAIGDEVTGFFTYLSHKEGSRCYFQTHDQLEKATAIGEKLTELLEDCESLEGEELVVGQACLAQDVDDVFYRAVISEKKGNEYKVVFVDYGTSREVSTSLMKQIPNELVSRPMNIVPLNLTDEQQEPIDMDREDYTLMLREGSETKGWIVTLVEVERQAELSNSIGDTSHLKLDAKTNDESPSVQPYSSLSYVPSAYKHGDSVVGFFTSVSHSEGCLSYFQTHDMLESAASISEQVLHCVDSSQVLTEEDILVGTPCLAQDVDGNFYRAKVMKLLHDDGYKVIFVDYGTTGTVDISLMKKVPENLLKTCINVLPFMLTVSQMESIDMNREDYIIKLSTGDEANGWNIIFEDQKDDSVAVVTVSIDSDPINDRSSAIEGCSTTSSPVSVNKKETFDRNALGYARARLSIGDKLTGYFTFLSHNEDFISYFQTEQMCDKAASIGERICEIVSDSYDIPFHEVDVGVPCLGQDDDGIFYRAVVTKKIDEQFEVLFVDYGSFNTPTVPLKRISDDLLSIAISVCPFMLTCDVMKTLDVDNVYSVKLVDGNEDSGWQVSFVDDACTEEVPQEQIGIGYPKRNESIGDVKRCMALIVSTSTNDLSYIQVQSEETTNTMIDEVLSNCKSVTLSPDQLVVGQACVAPHEDDGLFYRAIITAIDDDVFLRFVDWGNKRKAKADMLQVLPQSIRQIPTLAIPVRLTESQIENMDVDSVYEVTFISGSYDDGWVIDFRVDPEVTVETSITPTSSIKSPVTLDSPPVAPSSEVPDQFPCREEVSANFVKSSADQRNFHGALRVSGIIISRPVKDVGEAIGATEVVYFRSTADEKQLDDINERLESITFNDSVGWRLRQLPTSLCVPNSACLMHDVGKKKWYRGQILAPNLPNETVVLQLVDHGNRQLPSVPINRLYRLPKWLRGVVPLCLACHPRDTDSWEVVRSNHHVLMRLVGVDSSTGAVTASFSPHVPYDREQLMQIKDRVLLNDSFGAQSVIRQSMPSAESLDSTYGTVEANVIDVTEQGFLQISLVAQYLNTKKFCDKVDSIYQLFSECLVPVSKPIVNGAYVCRDADGHFVRVRVVAFSPTDNTCALQFLDNGHTKTLSNVHYYYLFPHLCQEEPRAWLCDAFDVESIKPLSQEERNLIRTILSNHTLQMRFKSDDPLHTGKDKSNWWRPFKVSFPEECLTEVTSEGLKQVATIITSGQDGFVQENGNQDVCLTRIPTLRISPSQQIEVRVTCVDSPHSFWCRDVQSQKSIEKIQGSLLASLGTASSPLDTGDETVNIVIGGYYALMSSWGWRRVVIIDYTGDHVVVQCVDDGQRVETNPKYLRGLPNPGAASQIPCLAMHCSLYGVLPPDGSGWKKQECAEFKMHAMEGLWIATVERIVPTCRGHDLESLFCVSLVRSENGLSLSQSLVQEQILIPDNSRRNLSVSSCGSTSNDVGEDSLDGEEVSYFSNGVHEKMVLPPKICLPSEAEIVITRVHSCKDFSVCQVHDLHSFHIDMKELKELPPKIEVDVNSPQNRLIWCSVIRANQLCRVLMKLPGDNDKHIQFEFVDEGIVEVVQMDSFLGGLHEMPSGDWLHKPRSAVRCSLYSSSGADATPLRNRLRDKRELSAFVNKMENGVHVVALLDRVDGVDVDVISFNTSR